MLPAEGREEWQHRVGDVVALGAHLLDHAGHLDGVPQHDGGGDEGQAARAVLQRFGGSVAHATEAMEADGAGQCITRLALVELDGGLTAKRRILQPVEGEEGALDPTNLPQREGETVLTGISAEAAEHHRSRYGAGADRGRQTQQVIPVVPNEGGVDATCDEGLQRRPGFRGAEGVETAVAQVGAGSGYV